MQNMKLSRITATIALGFVLVPKTTIVLLIVFLMLS